MVSRISSINSSTSYDRSFFHRSEALVNDESSMVIMAESSDREWSRDPAGPKGGFLKIWGRLMSMPSPKSCQQMSFVLAMRVGKIKFDMLIFVNVSMDFTTKKPSKIVSMMYFLDCL